MTDHDKLRQAIDMVRAGPRFSRAGLITLSQDQAELLASAAESTLPKTKMVEMWAVWHASEEGLATRYMAEAIAYPTREMAEEEAQKCINDGFVGVCITGPHQQEVPA